MPYAQPSDMLIRYDTRRLGQLVRDDGTEATPTQLLTDPVLAAMLSDGASLINSAILRGDRYAPADLSLLTGDDLALLLRLNSDLAYGNFLLRRGFTEEEIGKLSPGYKAALGFIKMLEDGALVFNITSARATGRRVTPTPMSTSLQLISSKWRHFGILNDENFPFS